MHVIAPSEAARTRGLLLVDLRPAAERHQGVGFIPGSVGIPASEDSGLYADAIRRVARDRVAVLVCTSGTRARDRALKVAPHLRMPLAVLEGGVLGWAAAGLPLCGCVPPSEPAPRCPPDQVPRQMLACFVGELADIALDRELDPLELLRECFERAGQSYDEPVLDQLHDVLDHAALLSLDLGTPIERVAANLDRMSALLPRVALSRSA